MIKKPLSKLLCTLLSAFALTLVVATPETARADTKSGWVYQGWESVKAGVSVDASGAWYAWGSVWFDGAIASSSDPSVLWVQGTLYRWDGSNVVACSQTGWFHPKQPALYALQHGTPKPCGPGWYLARASVYSRVQAANGSYVFNGGHLDTEWTWVN